LAVNPGRARRIELPAALARNGSDDALAFALVTPQARTRTPEQWARAVFEQGPVALRLFVDVGWRAVLRLRLAPRHAPGHVAGWVIAAVDERPDTITLSAQSALLPARNIVAVDDAVVEWVTTVHFERRVARPVWAVASRIHCWTICFLLTRASKRIAQRSSPS
jgi:hypothetical protein